MHLAFGLHALRKEDDGENDENRHEKSASDVHGVSVSCRRRRPGGRTRHDAVSTPELRFHPFGPRCARETGAHTRRRRCSAMLARRLRVAPQDLGSDRGGALARFDGQPRREHRHERESTTSICLRTRHVHLRAERQGPPGRHEVRHLDGDHRGARHEAQRQRRVGAASLAPVVQELRRNEDDVVQLWFGHARSLQHLGHLRTQGPKIDVAGTEGAFPNTAPGRVVRLPSVLAVRFSVHGPTVTRAAPR